MTLKIQERIIVKYVTEGAHEDSIQYDKNDRLIG